MGKRIYAESAHKGPPGTITAEGATANSHTTTKGNTMQELTVHGTTCYLPEQVQEARTRAETDIGLNALRCATRIGYAWPGGYEIAGIMSDGELVCGDCLKKEYRAVYASTRDKDRDGWQVVSTAIIGMDCEDVGLCAHCNKSFK